jgi:hypothetical protein
MSRNARRIRLQLVTLPLVAALASCALADRRAEDARLGSLRAFCAAAERGSVPPSDMRGVRRTSAVFVSTTLQRIEQAGAADSLPDPHWTHWADSAGHAGDHVVCRDLAAPGAPDPPR